MKENQLKLYVGNLPLETTEAQLRESFVPFGTISSLSIVTDKESGKSRGFAFVEMSLATEGQAAITGMNGKSVGGNMLKVNEATKKA